MSTSPFTGSVQVEFSVNFGDFLVPGLKNRQAEIYTSAWTVTHDAASFPDPYAFKPDRWLDGDEENRREASQPFSLGPRACLGRK